MIQDTLIPISSTTSLSATCSFSIDTEVKLLEFLCNATLSYFPDSVYFLLCAVPTTYASIIMCEEKSVSAQTIQAVSYIETCSNEEINDLVSQIDLALEQDNVKVRTLKK